jgi:hypothetical protein
VASITWKSTAYSEPSTAIVGRDIGAAGLDVGRT